MRILLLLSFFLFTSLNAVSQSRFQKRKMAKHRVRKAESKTKGTIIVSMDTIFNKGVAYAILKKKKQIPYYAYSLRGLDNEELVEITTQVSGNKDQTPYYLFYFTESGNKAELEKYYGLKLEKEIVLNNLVEDNRIDPRSETDFLIKYTRRFSDPSIKQYVDDKPSANAVDPYNPVKRNRDAKIYFRDGRILQDYKMIGYYKTVDSTLRFYLPNNLMVAEVTTNETDPHQRTIMGMKERKSRNIKVTDGKELEEIATYLCELNYL